MIPRPTRRLLLAALAASPFPAAAQGRADTLRYVTGGAVNTLDPGMTGATQEATALSACFYDRLLRFGRKPSADGAVFDFDRLEGELAERFTVEDGGRAVTFHLRPGARWHDGGPVTTEDVLWSFARAVQAPGLGRGQMATGSLTEAGQMAAVGEGVVRLSLPRPDRLALPNLATLFAPMLNSRLARQHATDADPWAAAWLKANTAGGGAFRVTEFVPGERVALERSDAWSNGPLPGFRRAALQTVPEPATRALLMVRGDAELATGLGPEELRLVAAGPAARVASTPSPTGFAALVFNTGMPPFDRVEVRRALAAALPVAAMFAAAVDGRGLPLFGAPWDAEPPGPGFPQALPSRTDEAVARRMLAEAGLGGGFATTLAFATSRAGWAEPAAALAAEALGRLGVRVRIEKLPDAQMAEAVTARRLPMLLERSAALFPSAEYFFRIFLSGPGRWNLPGWADAEVDRLLPEARFEPDPARADALARHLVARLADQVPMVPLWQPSYDVAAATRIEGLVTWPHLHPDLRDPVRPA